ncbi:hypothetical protein CAPTEDRAFT_226394 [Capitella teleta]|uniref:dolichol kinase n=1 Tax=Capitella teleta TaxID=283909 RepID=R7UJJ9_CAPTE|nr:hypothetical protein CAPTEDRAFT_226394 [Capitella teleta]|eukprot:ELU06739.1 hypothetical protein CAPTEDRAFT_226394 [Capitella teleta]
MSDRLASYLAVISYGLVASKLAFLNAPPILIGFALMLSAAVAWVERKQIDAMPSRWGWKPRLGASSGLSFCLLVPLCVLLSTYHIHGSKVKKDPFLRVVVSACLSLSISSVLFFFLTAAGYSPNPKLTTSKQKNGGLRDDEKINFSFYGMASLSMKEMAFLGAILIIFLLALSQILTIIPRSFSLGEAAICCQSICLLLVSFGALFLHQFKIAFTHSQHLASTPEVIVFMEVAMVSCMLMVFILYMTPVLQCAVGFYALLLLVMAVFSLPLLFICLKKDFVLWLVIYIQENSTKTGLFSYWAACLVAAAGLVFINTHKSRQKRSITTATRKQFHLLALAVIVPGLVADVEITCLALTCAVIVFIMVETMRILDVVPFGQSTGQHFLMFADQQDQGPLLLTPLYLLCGCTAPLWLFPLDRGAHISLFGGVLSLGVGDTVAAVVGSKAGSIYWFGVTPHVDTRTESHCDIFRFECLLIAEAYQFDARMI